MAKAKSAAQRAAQERFREAAKQAKREGKKGKSYARRVGELLRGRASHGAGRKTRASSSGGSNPSGGASRGRSMTTKSKPKPRLGMYLGLGGSAAVAAGVTREGNLDPVLTHPSDKLGAATGNVGKIFSNEQGVAVKVAIPAALGLAASLAADKLGVNKMLAKARWPFRV